MVLFNWNRKKTPLKRIFIAGPGTKQTDEVKKAYKKAGFLIIGDGNNPVSKEEIQHKIDQNGGIDKDTIITITAHGSAKEGGGHTLSLHTSPGEDDTKNILEGLASISPTRKDDPTKKTPLQIHLLACYAGASASTSGDREPDYSVLPEGSVLVAHGSHDSAVVAQDCSAIELAIAKSGDRGVFHSAIKGCLLEMHNVSIGMRLPEGKCETIVLSEPRKNLALKNSLVEYFDDQWAKTLRERIAADKGELPSSVKKTKIPTRVKIAKKVTNNFEDYQSNLIFSKACVAKTEAECTNVIEYIRHTGKKPDDFKKKSFEGTLLSYLSYSKVTNKKMIKALIENGADPNAKDQRGYTPLHWVGLAEVAEVLIDAGANLNSISESGRTPVYLAKQYNNETELIHLLDPSHKDSNGQIYLHNCDNPTRAQALIKAGADVNAKDKDGRTPLHYAKNPEVALKLIEAGADVNTKDKDGRTPLHYAKNPEVAIKLIEAGADAFVKDNFDKKPIDFARERGFVDKLLDRIFELEEAKQTRANPASLSVANATRRRASISEALNISPSRTPSVKLGGALDRRSPRPSSSGRGH